jgi:2-polyprenyl-3-methyl-5-hydroxy-6-metoxy-1,4-benzoquinol methylase
MPDTEEKILDAALKVLISEGYADATTRRIAQEANVTEMTLLQKFPSKENLFREARKKNPNEFLKYWDEAYKSVPPWDLDHPQPAFQALINANEIKPGRVLDIGCGRGENAIMLAMNGYDVTGIDLAEAAISRAKAKTIERHVKVNFVVGNVLQMDRLFMVGEFDVVIDSGLFHAMMDEERPVFARQVWRVLKTGGKYFMLCFSDKELSEDGPIKLSKTEIEQTFTPFFNIIYIKDTTFDTRFGPNSRKAYLLSAIKN